MLSIITIDGPSGVGKGTLSKQLVNVLKWNLLDSGVIYRVLALMALENKIDINNENELSVLASTIQVNFINKENQLFVLSEGKEVSNSIYTEFIGNIASKIAIFPKVRKVLCRYQRTFYMYPGLVADGRDMGTVVFPHAICKIFLNASLEERKRRCLCRLQKEIDVDLMQSALSKIIERDDRDYNRKLAPLIPAIDALILDSTNLSAEEVMNKVLIRIEGLVYFKESIV